MVIAADLALRYKKNIAYNLEATGLLPSAEIEKRQVTRARLICCPHTRLELRVTLEQPVKRFVAQHRRWHPCFQHQTIYCQDLTNPTAG